MTIPKSVSSQEEREHTVNYARSASESHSDLRRPLMYVLSGYGWWMRGNHSLNHTTVSGVHCCLCRTTTIIIIQIYFSDLGAPWGRIGDDIRIPSRATCSTLYTMGSIERVLCRFLPFQRYTFNNVTECAPGSKTRGGSHPAHWSRSHHKLIAINSWAYCPCCAAILCRRRYALSLPLQFRRSTTLNNCAERLDVEIIMSSPGWWAFWFYVLIVVNGVWHLMHILVRIGNC